MYIGSKRKIAQELRQFVDLSVETYIEPFCGGCNMISEIVSPKHKIANDKNKYLIAMWKALQLGWIPPSIVSEDEYKYVRDHKEENLALTGFVGFSSFGSKFFGGYPRDNTGKNRIDMNKRGILEQLNKMRDVEFFNEDYKFFTGYKNAVIYCDPPYENTTGYICGVNHTEFWEWCRQESKNNRVFISSYQAPEDFVKVWEKEVTTCLDQNQNVKEEKMIRYERLFCHESVADKYELNKTMLFGVLC